MVDLNIILFYVESIEEESTIARCHKYHLCLLSMTSHRNNGPLYTLYNIIRAFSGIQELNLWLSFNTWSPSKKKTIDYLSKILRKNRL